MHRRMQCLDPPVEHFRKAGHGSDFGDRQPGIGQRARRAAGRDQRHAARHQRPRERHQPLFVADRDQRAADRRYRLGVGRVVHCVASVGLPSLGRIGRGIGAAAPSGKARQQHQHGSRRDREAECARDCLGGPAGPDQDHVRGDYPPHDGGMAEAAPHGLLIEMLAVRQPDALAAGEAAQQRDRRVGQEIERQDQRDLPVPAGGGGEQQEADQIAERHAADIAEKDARRRPVPDEKPDRGGGDRGGERRRDRRHRPRRR